MIYNIVTALIAIIGFGYGYYQSKLYKKDIKALLLKIEAIEYDSKIKDKQIEILRREPVDTDKLLEDGEF